MRYELNIRPEPFEGYTRFDELETFDTELNVIDKRIDVHAQYALQRMLKHADPGVVGVANAMLKAIKVDGTLAGIYKEDQYVPAMMAKKMNLGWWQLLPKGEHAALVLDVQNPLINPIIIFADKVKTVSQLLDQALQKAWEAFRQFLNSLSCGMPSDSKLAQAFIPAHRARFCVAGQRFSENCESLKPPRCIRRVVIHTVAVKSRPGLSGVQAVINDWKLPPPADKEASAHYLVDRDGTITQMVHESDVAFHVGRTVNPDSIGIEHADICNDPAPYTTQLYERSAALVRDIARRNRFQINEQTVVGHVTFGGHTDPGPYWDWEYYYALLRWNEQIPQARPVRFVSTTAQQAGRPAGWQVRNRRAIEDQFCSDARDPFGSSFLSAQQSASGQAVEFSFLVFIRGVYKISLWWPKIGGENPEVPVDIQVRCTFGKCQESFSRTVSVDQRVRSGQWNDVGSPFTISTVVQVVVTIRRDSPKPGLIHADAVRLLKIGPAPPITI